MKILHLYHYKCSTPLIVVVFLSSSFSQFSNAKRFRKTYQTPISATLKRSFRSKPQNDSSVILIMTKSKFRYVSQNHIRSIRRDDPILYLRRIWGRRDGTNKNSVMLRKKINRSGNYSCTMVNPFRFSGNESGRY